MDKRLYEKAARGTPFYPLQLYRMKSGERSASVPFHWHREVEILLLREGRLSLTVGEEHWEWGPGDLCFINLEELHAMHTLEMPYWYDAVVFPPEFLSFATYDYAQSHYLSPLCKKTLLFPRTLERTNDCYEAIYRELTEIADNEAMEVPARQLSTKASLLKIVALLAREGRLTELFPQRDDKNLKAILSYIAEHHTERMTLEQISDAFGFSPKYFSRYFKKNFGRTFVEYLNDYRVQRARELLLTTELPVLEVALSVGFDHFSYFIRRFREVTGCTPGRYRALQPRSPMEEHVARFINP